MKTKDESLKDFYWQKGYGAFSVNKSETDKVISYISNQYEHHNKITSQDKYRRFLKKYKVKYDERYVWDYINYSVVQIITGLHPVLWYFALSRAVVYCPFQ